MEARFYDFVDGAYSSRSFAEFDQLPYGRLHAADPCGLAGSTLQCQLGPGIPGNREVLEWDAGLGPGDDDHYNLRAKFVHVTDDEDLDLLAFDHVGHKFSVFTNLSPDDRAPATVFAMGPGQPFLANLNCDGVVDVLTIGPDGLYQTLSQP